jgi:hypothetical protein
MEYLGKLPFLLGASAALITGLVCFNNMASNNQTYLRMLISMIIFYILGVYIRNLLTGIVEEQKEKLRIEEEAKKKLEEEAAAAVDLELREKAKAEGRKSAVDKILGGNIDIVQGAEFDSDFGEDFKPLKVGDLVNRETR